MAIVSIYLTLSAIRPPSNPPTLVRIRLLANFFLPFQILNHTRKAFIFNINEGNNQKVEIKVSGSVRVGVGRALLVQ